MWQPQTEQEIEAAISNGLQETLLFEAKQQLPDKNSELAKDVAAMANAAGGTFLFGIGEDFDKKLTKLEPFALRGVKEKIDQIIQTSISENPIVRIVEIESQKQTGKGYILLVIPPSDRVPHMVVVKKEHRYYGRTATGNKMLGETEVARLYERRKKIETKFSDLIQTAIENAPLQPSEDASHLHIVIKPLIEDKDLLNQAMKNHSLENIDDISTVNQLLTEYFTVIDRRDLFPHRRSSERGIGIPAYSWQRRLDSYYNDFDRSLPPADTYDKPSNVCISNIGFDGTGEYFCNWLGSGHESPGSGYISYFFTIRASKMVTDFIAVMGELFSDAGYLGQVYVGVGITGLKGKIDNESIYLPERLSPAFHTDIFHNSGSYPAHRLKEEPQKIGFDILEPFLETIAPGKDPIFR